MSYVALADTQSLAPTAFPNYSAPPTVPLLQYTFTPSQPTQPTQVTRQALPAPTAPTYARASTVAPAQAAPAPVLVQSAIMPPQPIAAPSNKALIIGGVIAAAVVVGGVVWYSKSKKKAAA